MKNYESLVDALDDLRKRGYEADTEHPQTIHRSNSEILKPEP